MSERPTPETDSQIKTFTSVSKLKKSFENRTGTVSAGFARKLERERDEAREAARTLAEHGENEIQKLIKERDEAREALLKIEDRCVDCEDACDDIQKIREIAVKALEEAK